MLNLERNENRKITICKLSKNSARKDFVLELCCERNIRPKWSWTKVIGPSFFHVLTLLLFTCGRKFL